MPSGTTGSSSLAAAISSSAESIPAGVAPSNTRTCSTLGTAARIPLEHRRELGVDVDDGGVAMVGDVGGLLVGQPVVQRHGRDTQLASGADHGDDTRRVLAAPNDLRRPGPGAEADEDAGEAVRLRSNSAQLIEVTAPSGRSSMTAGLSGWNWAYMATKSGMPWF